MGLKNNRFCCPTSTRGAENNNGADNYELSQRPNDRGEKTEVDDSPETVNVTLRSVDSIAVISSNMYVAT